jgi:hypothetical protein
LALYILENKDARARYGVFKDFRVEQRTECELGTLRDERIWLILNRVQDDQRLLSQNGTEISQALRLTNDED